MSAVPDLSAVPDFSFSVRLFVCGLDDRVTSSELRDVLQGFSLGYLTFCIGPRRHGRGDCKVRLTGVRCHF